MHPIDVETALSTLTILVDTREQPNARYEQRLNSMKTPYKREKLDFGDYSAEVTLPSGELLSLDRAVCVERKMSFDEICNCYCQQRKRFTREFERAKSAGAKVYLLIENANWEKAYNGSYRSKMSPQALTASLFAWLARYNCQIIFCKEETSGKIIREILYREMKERLENG